MDLPDYVGSFLFTDEEVAVLQRFQMSVPSEREAAVANGSAEVLRKIFDYTMDDDGVVVDGMYEHGANLIKNKVDFPQLMKEPGLTLLFLGTE
jgi:hypothetical protein